MSEPFWKKEISLRRKPKAVEETVVAVSAEPVEVQPVEAQPVEAPAVEPPAVEPPADETPRLPAGDYGWLTAGFDPNAIPEAMPAISAPVVDVPVPEPKSAPSAPAAPARPSAPVMPPVAEAPQPVKEKKLRREVKLPKLELRRRPKEPKPPKERKQKAEADPSEAKVPFWKRELRARPKQVTTETVTERKPPIWKRELKLSRPKLERKPKGEKLPKGEKQPKQRTVKAPKTGKNGALVGLKIGASQVAAARVSSGSSPQLLQIAREPLQDGVVVGGELRDVEALTVALKALFAKNKLPKRGVRLGIANNRIGVRTFEITGIDDPRQLANAIRFRAQETLPIPLEEAVLDWQVLEEWQDEETGGLTRRVLLVVAYRELVDRYVAACKKAGIKLSGIDLEAFAMLRALAPPPAPDAPEATGAQVVVNVGHDRSTFAVSNGRVCEFTRVLGWGGQSLSVAIARVLDATPSEVMPVKHALSLVAQATPPEGVAPETMNLARDAVTRELQSFARELVSSLRFYQNQPGSLGIGEVVLTGGTAHMPGFADELHRLIGVPVRVGDPLNRLVLPKKFQEPDDYSLGSLTVAIGLGIED